MLEFKPDFAQTTARFEAWWHGELIDRPPVTLRLPPSAPAPAASAYPTLRDRWLDVAGSVDRQLAALPAQQYIGDGIPKVQPDIGPELLAALLGCELEFSEASAWAKPIVDDVEQWVGILQREPDWGNVYWRAIEEGTAHAIEVCRGKCLVGITDLHGCWDTLAALRDPEMLCMDLIDAPETVAKVGRRVAPLFGEAVHRLYGPIRAAGMGATTWCPIYHDGPAYLPSCDFWCMVGPDLAREIILPDILTETRALERSLFHLDGPQALQHLDLLLEIPELNAVQWVYGAGAGPVSNWFEVYQRVRAAGKSVEVQSPTMGEAVELVERLGPEGLWFSGVDCDSRESGEAFLKELTRLSVAAG